jgi:hypothetical protein
LSKILRPSRSRQGAPSAHSCHSWEARRRLDDSAAPTSAGQRRTATACGSSSGWRRCGRPSRILIRAPRQTLELLWPARFQGPGPGSRTPMRRGTRSRRPRPWTSGSARMQCFA